VINNQQVDIDSVKENLINLIKTTNVPLEAFGYLGEMAEQVMTDKSLYPKFVDEMLLTGIAEENDLPKKIDYRILITFAALGNVARSMSKPKEML
jgi:hypothetical protein